MRSSGQLCVCVTRVLTCDTHSLGPVIDMSHMSRVTYESDHRRGMSHIEISGVTCKDESSHTYEGGMSHKSHL